MVNLNKERAYKSMHLIRRVEEEIIRVYDTDVIKSPVHLSIGQEAVSVAVCETLAPNDVVFGTYRGHALYLAKGGDLNGMMAELFGKADGVARGKAGSMHLIDRTVNMMGTSAVVATTIPHALGYAHAAKVRQTGQVIVVFFGDGATEEGVFHETINFAAVKKLPILFVCENNFYAIYTGLGPRVGDTKLTDRVRAYNIPTTYVGSGAYEDIFDAAKTAVSAIRGDGGPQFIECKTYRWRDHVGPGEDRHLQYRADHELDDWIERDEVRNMGAKLPPETRARIEAEVAAALNEAMSFAEASPFPGSEELLENVYHD